jgi:predicted 2-oxoglutarate/Fe(II)-dependent dioxygenase YbiX
MPGPEFFAKLGLFVCENFLSSASCARLRSEMIAASSQQGEIFTKKRGFNVDESIRRVLCSDVPRATELRIGSQLKRLRPALQQHFQTPLDGCDGPYFLKYGAGDFYKAHRDSGRAGGALITKRRVSIVVFLNAAVTDPPGRDGYGGGALTFYGLMPGAQWRNYGFPLEASPGLLIAFPSHVFHEVGPVSSGQRFTIAAWFSAAPPAKSAKAGHRGAKPGRGVQVRKRVSRSNLL